MNSVGGAGDDAPGFLGLGVQQDPVAFREREIARIADGLAACVESLRAASEGRSGPERPLGRRRFRPRSFYMSPAAVPAASARRYAVMPFLNDTGRRDAGDLVSLRFVAALAEAPGIEVVEPGVVREALLRTRLVQSDGVSLPQAALLRELLDADVVVTGRVAEWEDAVGEGGVAPYVAFTARGIDTRRSQVSWTATVGRRGDAGVFFFGAGRVHTANELASEEALGVIDRVVEETKRAMAPVGAVSTGGH
jgi:hypothetical protein